MPPSSSVPAARARAVRGGHQRDGSARLPPRKRISGLNRSGQADVPGLRAVRPVRHPAGRGREAPSGAAAGTCWPTGLTTTASQLIAPPQPAAADSVDAAAISGIAASTLRIMPGTKFTAIVQAITSGLAQTSAPVYEKALASLGRRYPALLCPAARR